MTLQKVSQNIQVKGSGFQKSIKPLIFIVPYEKPMTSE